MQKNFRQKELIDRGKEINFLLNWFNKIPDEILWIYGPKSSGKTTLVEYVIENELFEDFWGLKPKENYWVKYMNLRRYLIANYNNFIEAFIQPKEEKEKKEEALNARFSIGIFEIKASILNEIRERKKDLFKVLISNLQEIGRDKRIIIVIDEIQTLEDIYIGDNRELLKEFLNFCVSLTKELHIAHVVILSSNTVFIERIYNDARLKVTSRFYKIDHLDRDTTEEWLKKEGFSEDEIELIWEYLGGCIPLIQRMMRDRHEFSTLKEYLEHQKWLAYTEIVHFINFSGKITKEERKLFKDIAEEIVKKGFFTPNDTDRYRITIEKFAQVEILFFDPLSLNIIGNNRLYEKGMEILFEK